MLGAPIGLLWAAVSPKVLVERTSQGLALVSTETKSFIAADGWFFFIVLASGLVCGVVAWRLGRRYPLGTSLGLLVGCVVAALVARRVGHLVDLPRLSAVLDSLSGKPIIDPTLDVRAKGLLFVWPFSAVATYVVLLGLRPGR
jgi:hypothetical protein